MSTELLYLVCVSVLTALLWIPYILNVITVRGLKDAVGYPDNPKPLAPWASRMKAAHYNAVENQDVPWVQVAVYPSGLDVDFGFERLTPRGANSGRDQIRFPRKPLHPLFDQCRTICQRNTAIWITRRVHRRGSMQCAKEFTYIVDRATLRRGPGRYRPQRAACW